MNFSFLHLSLLSFFCLISIGCGDDPALVEKREKQKAELVRMKGELALIEEKLKNLPPDVSEELAQAKVLSSKLTDEVAKLEAELAELEAKKRAQKSEFEAYQRKYQIQ
jgi:chromosome segregation ATPase